MTLDEHTAAESGPLGTSCITCGAQKGKPCTSPNGRVLDYVHSVREVKKGSRTALWDDPQYRSINAVHSK